MNLLIKPEKIRENGVLNYFKIILISILILKILDLGSENGDYTHKLLEGVDYLPTHIYIADINAKSVEDGNKKFGLTPWLLKKVEKYHFQTNSLILFFVLRLLNT